MTELQQFPQPYGVLRTINIVGLVVAGAAVAAMMLLIVVDVTGRVSGTSLIAGVFEISENYLMPLAVFPALGFIYASGVMPRFDVLLARVAVPVRKIVVYVLLGVELVVFGTVAWLTFGDFVSAFANSTTFIAGATSYPLWPVKIFVPLGFVMIVLETLFIFVGNIKGSRHAFSMAGLMQHDEGGEGVR